MIDALLDPLDEAIALRIAPEVDVEIGFDRVGACIMLDNLPGKESAPKVVIVLTIIPLAPPPLNGLISAVGKASTNRVSIPRNAKNVFMPSITISKLPLVRNKLMATNIPTR